jgi:hypothetical protein
MWRSERARCAAILDLLEAAHLASRDPRLDRGLWTPEGPTRLACQYIDKGSPLSSGEHLILQVAFDLWNGRGKAKIDDLLCTLDERLLRAVARAILARDSAALAEVRP